MTALAFASAGGRCTSGRLCSSSPRVAAAAAFPRVPGPMRRVGHAGLVRAPGGRGRTAVIAMAAADDDDEADDDDDNYNNWAGDEEEEEEEEDLSVLKDVEIKEENFPNEFKKALQAIRETPDVSPYQEWIRDGSLFMPAARPEKQETHPPADEPGKKAQEHKEEWRKAEWAAFIENCENIGNFSRDYMNILDTDFRLEKVQKEKEWTHEEIEEFIGYTGLAIAKRAVVIQPRTWRADFKLLRPYIPTTEEFLETHGRFFEEDGTVDETLLDSDFNDFDEEDTTGARAAAQDDGEVDRDGDGGGGEGDTDAGGGVEDEDDY